MQSIHDQYLFTSWDSCQQQAAMDPQPHFSLLTDRFSTVPILRTIRVDPATVALALAVGSFLAFGGTLSSAVSIPNTPTAQLTDRLQRERDIQRYGRRKLPRDRVGLLHGSIRGIDLGGQL